MFLRVAEGHFPEWVKIITAGWHVLAATGTEEDYTQNERKHKGMGSDAEWIQLE